MRPSTIRKIYSFFVAFVLTAVATPDWALGREPHRDSVEAADLSVMAVNKTDRRIEQIALREPDGIELDSDIFGYDGLAPRQWRAFTIPRGAGVALESAWTRYNRVRADGAGHKTDVAVSALRVHIACATAEPLDPGFRRDDDRLPGEGRGPGFPAGC